MNQGVIAVRYARALLKSVAQDENAKQAVYADMQQLAKSYLEVPALRKALDNPLLPKSEKENLLAAACGTPCAPTRAFLALVLKERRETLAQFMANAFVTLYRQEKNIISGRLITATAVSPATEQKMKSVIEGRSQQNVEFVTEVNADLIGGFILEYDTYRLDASVQTQLRSILKELK